MLNPTFIKTIAIKDAYEDHGLWEAVNSKQLMVVWRIGHRPYQIQKIDFIDGAYLATYKVDFSGHYKHSADGSKWVAESEVSCVVKIKASKKLTVFKGEHYVPAYLGIGAICQKTMDRTPIILKYEIEILDDSKCSVTFYCPIDSLYMTGVETKYEEERIEELVKNWSEVITKGHADMVAKNPERWEQWKQRVLKIL